MGIRVHEVHVHHWSIPKIGGDICAETVLLANDTGQSYALALFLMLDDFLTALRLSDNVFRDGLRHLQMRDMEGLIGLSSGCLG